MSEKELVELIKRIIAEKIEAKKQDKSEGDDVDFRQCVSNAINTTDFWNVTEIV